MANEAQIQEAVSTIVERFEPCHGRYHHITREDWDLISNALGKLLALDKRVYRAIENLYHENINEFAKTYPREKVGKQMKRTDYESINTIDELVEEAAKRITASTGETFSKSILTRISNSIIRYATGSRETNRNRLDRSNQNEYVQILAEISDDGIIHLRNIGFKSQAVIAGARELAKERLEGMAK